MDVIPELSSMGRAKPLETRFHDPGRKQVGSADANRQPHDNGEHAGGAFLGFDPQPPEQNGVERQPQKESTHRPHRHVPAGPRRVEQPEQFVIPSNQLCIHPGEINGFPRLPYR